MKGEQRQCTRNSTFFYRGPLPIAKIARIRCSESDILFVVIFRWSLVRMMRTPLTVVVRQQVVRDGVVHMQARCKAQKDQKHYPTKLLQPTHFGREVRCRAPFVFPHLCL